MKHSGQLFKSYAELSNTLEPTSGPATQSMSQPPADDNQADKFAEIKSLSIVASDWADRYEMSFLEIDHHWPGACEVSLEHVAYKITI